MCRRAVLLDIAERSMQRIAVRVAVLPRTAGRYRGRRNGSARHLVGFAPNSLPHPGMKRVCYEVKASRSDFLAKLKHPHKRRIGMRYSNEFYFVMPAQRVDVAEIPAECGLVAAGGRHGGRLDGANPAARWVFQL